jgi:hypothetical protein
LTKTAKIDKFTGNPNLAIKNKLIENSQKFFAGKKNYKGRLEGLKMISIEEEEKLSFGGEFGFEGSGWEDTDGMMILGFGLKPDRDCDGTFDGRIVLGVNDEKYYMKYEQK